MIKTAPAIHFDEFNHYATLDEKRDGFQVEERNHPEFGRWTQRSLDLDHIKIFEHRANLHQPLNVEFDDDTLGKYVHHCISIDGHMGAYFQNHSLSAELSSQSYHQVFVPSEEYILGMGKEFFNVHIEVERGYYADLLPDSENWSATLRRKLLDREMYYPGEFRLSQQMVHVIYEIFNSPLSGYLKRLLIEAKVHELIALQLNGSEIQFHSPLKQKSFDQFMEVRAYLDKTFLEEHSLKSIARQFGLNEFSLKKGFKSNFSTTVFDYLLSKRLDYARVLLQSTTQSVQEIGAITGYKYSNHFSAAFKKKFGISPSFFRQ